MPGDPERSRPQRPQQAVPLFPQAERRAQRSAGLSRPGCAVNNSPGPSRGQGASPPNRQEVQPHARTRAAVSPAPITARPHSQPDSPLTARSSALPGFPSHSGTPTHNPARLGCRWPERFKNGASHLPPAAPPAGPAARGARWERCRGDGRAPSWRAERPGRRGQPGAPRGSCSRSEIGCYKQLKY